VHCATVSPCLFNTDVLAVHRLAVFLEDTHLRHLPVTDRSALFYPPTQGADAAAPAPPALSPTAAASALAAYITALTPSYAGAPAVGQFYSVPAVAAWLARTALDVAIADDAAAAAADTVAGRDGAAGAAPAAGDAGGATAAAGTTAPAASALVVAGAAADPAVRAAAAALVAACGLAAPPGGSCAAAATAVATRHVLDWQAAKEAGRADAADADADMTPAEERLSLKDFPSGIATGGTLGGFGSGYVLGWRDRAHVVWRRLIVVPCVPLAGRCTSVRFSDSLPCPLHLLLFLSSPSCS